MGNFEKLSVLVIVVIIVMILVVALYTWTDDPDGASADPVLQTAVEPQEEASQWPVIFPEPDPDPDPIPDPDSVIHPIIDPDQIIDPDPDPNPEPPTLEPTSTETWLYTVKPGDTLSQIAEKELGTWRRMKEIIALNVGLSAESL
jgi:nucleoid-associated protein YgaU